MQAGGVLASMVRSNSHGIPQVSRIKVRDNSDRLERAETHTTTRFLFMPAPIQQVLRRNARTTVASAEVDSPPSKEGRDVSVVVSHIKQGPTTAPTHLARV